MPQELLGALFVMLIVYVLTRSSSCWMPCGIVMDSSMWSIGRVAVWRIPTWSQSSMQCFLTSRNRSVVALKGWLLSWSCFFPLTLSLSLTPRLGKKLMGMVCTAEGLVEHGCSKFQLFWCSIYYRAHPACVTRVFASVPDVWLFNIGELVSCWITWITKWFSVETLLDFWNGFSSWPAKVN